MLHGGIILPHVVINSAFIYNKGASSNLPLEDGNAILKPPFTSYKGAVHSWL
jgi:hypothetical protein